MKATTLLVVLSLAVSTFADGIETHFLVQMNCDGIDQQTYWDVTCKSTSQNINTRVGGDDGITSDVKGLTGSLAVATGTLDKSDGSFVEFTNMTFGTHQTKPHFLTLSQVAGHTTDINDINYMGVTYQITGGAGAFEDAEGYVSGIFNLDVDDTSGHLQGYWDASGVIIVPSDN